MKKEYKTPVVKTIALSTEEGVLNVGSPQGGIDTDSEFGRGFDEGAESYSNRRGNSIWGDTEW